jgi:hypothetical protein
MTCSPAKKAIVFSISGSIFVQPMLQEELRQLDGTDEKEQAKA